ncbi:cysteine hydrolase family protein [Streptomyces noursei]|uniref:cysteine hydrolase family protein n=1 Tax=Streptomyces noursei TaxID=1971 RepID=UPI001679BD54|nr:isochorismatase family cysteine hydrolase [Streptomyces noursei]MCZ1013349.1 cysteine hydrolase [Streptomyces noursei]GGX47588.1 hydrolase [Streptomyces noursei]
MAQNALLVMDIQRGIVDRFGEGAGYLARLRGAIEAARAADMPVIYVIVRFRAGRPEASARNKMLRGLGGGAGFTDEDPGAEIHPDIAPRPADLIVTRTRVSAFVGSDLGLLLRAREIDGLVLTGIATSGVVLSTLRQAADLDFHLTVLADGCLDADAEVHQVLTEKVFPVQADVFTVDDWITSIK